MPFDKIQAAWWWFAVSECLFYLADLCHLCFTVINVYIDVCGLAGRRRMTEAPPPPPPAVAAAVVSTQEMDNSNVRTCPRRMSGTGDIIGQHPTNIGRHLSVPCDAARASIEVQLSHSLPRPASKTAALSDRKVTILSVAALSAVQLQDWTSLFLDIFHCQFVNERHRFTRSQQ